MKFGVIVFPGSNCDLDAYYFIREVLREPVEYIWFKESNVDRFDALILPGGFSYGDYLRPGAIARFAPVIAAVEKFAARGGLVLGICNGFQVLLEAGLLPGALYRNYHLQFRCCHTYIRVENTGLPFTEAAHPGQVLKVPIAHGDGNYYTGSKQLQELQKHNRIVFRYVDQAGRATASANPNGSLDNIAGICNENGNVLGMMPHPERAGEALLGSTDGLLVFRSMIRSFQARGGVAR